MLLAPKAAASPWWTAPWVARLVRPEDGVLVPLAGVILLAFLAGWLLRRSGEASPPPPAPGNLPQTPQESPPREM